AAVAVSALLIAACGPLAPVCSASTCPAGCCDPSGECQAGFLPQACGSFGSRCAACASNQLCQGGFCAAPPGNTVDSGASDGGGGDAGADAGSDAGSIVCRQYLTYPGGYP